MDEHFLEEKLKAEKYFSAIQTGWSVTTGLRWNKTGYTDQSLQYRSNGKAKRNALSVIVFNAPTSDIRI